MSKKIKFISELIPQKLHNLIIDVGCDHGYLGISLIKTNKAKIVINIDNKLKPLENAILNTKKHNLEKQIINVLNDGLKDLSTKLNEIEIKPNYIVIAGIGTNNIIEILEKNNININETFFIFQTEGNIDQLKKYLNENSYKMIDEKNELINKKYLNFIITKKEI